LAIIADLLERANIDTVYKSVTLSIKEPEFKMMLDKITQKISTYQGGTVDDSFSVKIGEIDFVFNKSNV
jgi:hypothetical protein